MQCWCWEWNRSDALHLLFDPWDSSFRGSINLYLSSGKEMNLCNIISIIEMYIDRCLERQKVQVTGVIIIMMIHSRILYMELETRNLMRHQLSKKQIFPTT